MIDLGGLPHGAVESLGVVEDQVASAGRPRLITSIYHRAFGENQLARHEVLGGL